MQRIAFLKWLDIDRTAPESLYRQIGGQIRRAILTGRLSPGDFLPSSRALAADLRVSRITALQAYDMLVAEGFLFTRAGSGTAVSRDLPLSRRAALAARGGPHRRQIDAAQKSVLNVLDNCGRSLNVAFQPGIPSFDAFPHLAWSRLLAQNAARRDAALLDYTHIGGYTPLRSEIARYLHIVRGVDCDPEQVIVVTSVRAALAAVCAVLWQRGAPVAVEDPGYGVARTVLGRMGQRIVPIATDGEGLRVSELVAKAKGCAGAYLTPTHHWPTGVTLSAARRLALLDWAAKTGAWIVEDDYDSEFRFDSPPLSTLYAMDSGRVIYVGTFSKTFAPSVRVAYLVVPRARVRDFERTCFETATEPALHVQAALCAFMASGAFTRHIGRMRKLYAKRRTLLTQALEARFGARLRLKVPPGGLQILAELPDHVSPVEACRRAAAADIHLRDIAGNFIDQPPGNLLQIGFAAVPEAEIATAADRLVKAIDEMF